MSVYKSIVKNLAANSFGMGVNFLQQIAMVPLFITYWGVEKYADWIIITALSSFFAMTDLGLNRASNNEFVIRYQKGDLDACAKLQVNALLFVMSVFAVFVISSVLVAFVWGFKGVLGVKVFTETETSYAFIILLSQIFVTMYGRVYHGVFRATARTHIAIITDNIVRLGELSVLFLGIFFHLDIIALLTLYLAPSVSGALFKWIYTRRIFSTKLALDSFDKHTFNSLIRPSIAFMIFPMGQAISSQGLVFVVNSILGASILVAFTTTRTLVNFLRQLMNMLSTSVNPEICAAYGRDDKKTITHIYYRSLIITFLTTMFSVAVLIFAGKFIYYAWTKHAVVFDANFFYGMLFVMLASCLWGLSSVIPLATNTHARFTSAFLFSQLSGVLLCYLVLSINPYLSMIPLVLGFTESALFFFTLKENNKFLGIDFTKMYAELIFQTKFLFNKGLKLLTR